MIARKIDYCMITTENRNWVINIKNNIIANQRQRMQHKAVIIKLQVKLKNKLILNYQKTINTI